MASGKDGASVHKGHRQRVKQTLREHGIDSFNDHQVIEAMLFYSIANGDTNPVAHRLIDRFGSFSGVIDADFDELLTVDGIGENSALLINLIRMLISRYVTQSCCDGGEKSFTGTEMLRQFFEGMFIGSKQETIYAAAFDNDLKLVRTAALSEGTSGEVFVRPRAVVDFAIKNRSNSIAIAHNHPSGTCMPSRSDIDITTDLVRTLRGVEVELVDHIIVGKDGSYSLRTSKHSERIWGIAAGR